LNGIQTEFYNDKKGQIEKAHRSLIYSTVSKYISAKQEEPQQPQNSLNFTPFYPIHEKARKNARKTPFSHPAFTTPSTQSKRPTEP
jgi:hypothetical protein